MWHFFNDSLIFTGNLCCLLFKFERLFFQKIDCVHNQAVMELMRGVRQQMSELISGLGVQDLAPMSLGLSHSLSRYKLKFSADKVCSLIYNKCSLNINNVTSNCHCYCWEHLLLLGQVSHQCEA